TVAVTTPSGQRTLEAAVILLCTGSRPAVPDVAGLSEAGFLTTDEVFDIDDPPSSVVVIGGGPAGVELSQAFTPLGLRTALFQRAPTILPRDEPSLVSMLQDRLVADGVELHTGAEATSVTIESGERVVHADGVAAGGEAVVVATGRAPNVAGLGLE